MIRIMRHVHKRNSYRALVTLLIIVFVYFTRILSPGPPAGSGYKKAEIPKQATSSSVPRGPVIEERRVSRVIDGDTIELADGQRVRYIGIDTPETLDPRRPVACFGKEASAENRRLAEGKTVLLEKDISQTDKYGRLLRYVYIGDVMINEYLVQQGFARVATYPPDIKYTERFLTAEKDARTNNRGLWSGCP